MSEDNDDIQDPVTSVLASAIAMHELYLTLQQAGFTSWEALFIVAQALRPTQS